MTLKNDILIKTEGQKMTDIRWTKIIVELYIKYYRHGCQLLVCTCFSAKNQPLGQMQKNGRHKIFFAEKINKHLMTGHKGNSEFCFPETLKGPVIKCFVIPPDSKIEKAPEKNYLLEAALAKLSGCQSQPVLSKNHDNSLFLRS